MHMKRTVVLLGGFTAGLLLAWPALAQEKSGGPNASSMRMTYVPQETRREAQEERQEARQEAREEARQERAETRQERAETRQERAETRDERRERDMEAARPRAASVASGAYEFRGVTSFFNIREANPNIKQNEWEFEINSGWRTQSDWGDDDMFMSQALRYGVTDQFYVELAVLQPAFGDGGDTGAGDMVLTLFFQFVEETDEIPAIAGLASMRIPSGDGSSGVDGRFSGIVSKSIAENFRAHLQGYVETVNGSSGSSGGAWLRPFRWGVGPGFDYRIDDNNLIALNYLHQVDEEVGVHNENILQVGSVHNLGELASNVTHGLKFALDVGLDGSIGTPNYAAKVQWNLQIK